MNPSISGEALAARLTSSQEAVNGQHAYHQFLRNQQDVVASGVPEFDARHQFGVAPVDLNAVFAGLAAPCDHGLNSSNEATNGSFLLSNKYIDRTAGARRGP